MFYLLQDNKIINSKDYWENVIGIDKDGKTYYRVEIKKQSENVFDLIEVGDLVKTLGIFRVDEINTSLKQIYSFLDRESIMVINTLGVKAIYKPDSQGNYIKVWEKKEDE